MLDNRFPGRTVLFARTGQSRSSGSFAKQFVDILVDVEVDVDVNVDADADVNVNVDVDVDIDVACAANPHHQDIDLSY